jgi:hypothetical protein
MYLFFHSFIYCICLSCNEWTIGGLLDSTKQVSWQSCIADRPSFEAATYVHVGPFSEGNMLSPCHVYCLTRPRSSQTPGQLLSKGLKIVGIPVRNTYIPNWSKLCKCIGCTIPGFGSIGIYRPVVSIYPNCISQYIPVAGSSMQGWPPQPFHLLVERAQRGSIGPCRVPGPARRHGISWHIMASWGQLQWRYCTWSVFEIYHVLPSRNATFGMPPFETKQTVLLKFKSSPVHVFDVSGGPPICGLRF